jgi:basic membrane protein A
MSRRAKVVLSLAVANILLMLLGLGRGGDATCRADLCVGLVFDVGGLGDQSFNDAAHRGLERAREELGVGVRYVEPGDGSDRESALRKLADEGYDLVIGVGFIFSDDVRKLAGEFPEVKFACIDYSPKPDEVMPDNLVGLRFREHEGSFLVGAIAGLVSKTETVGFVGGMKTGLIGKFEKGFAAGVRHVCPGCKVLATYIGTDPKAFADPTTGKEIALGMYDRGADIIYHASGKSGRGVFNAAKARNRWAIGVDSDQFHEEPGHVLTSMVKRVDVAVFDAVQSLQDGEFAGGVRDFGLKEDGVGFVYDDNNRDRIPARVARRVQQIRDAVIRGEIEVPSQ